MRRVNLVASTVVAFFLALLAVPRPALAGQAQGQAEHTLTGTVVYVGPVAFAVDTGARIETFRIPPGADWAAQLIPDNQVTLTWKTVPVEASRAVVRVEPAVAQARQAQAAGAVTGRIAFIDSAEMAVETARGVRTFAFGADSARPHGLVAGDDVRVTYENPPATVIDASRAAVVGAAAVHRQGGATMLGAALNAPARGVATATTSGEVVAASPDLVVLATPRGLEDFVVDRASRLHGAYVGDDVRIRYENEGAAAQQAVITSYPDILHPAW